MSQLDEKAENLLVLSLVDGVEAHGNECEN